MSELVGVTSWGRGNGRSKCTRSHLAERCAVGRQPVLEVESARRWRAALKCSIQRRGESPSVEMLYAFCQAV